ncbi:flagellar protein FliS [Metabacillus fastidiosus]|uniref:flagellar protein FliS n=1 Tax=Metabacillus fastidiosus TaxID=1458 RepID=UPI003D2B8FD2
MDIKKATKLYRENSLMALPMRNLVLWLLEEVLKTLEKGKQAMRVRDIAEQNKQMKLSQQLIIEIIPLINSSLIEGEKLIVLTEYINRQLILANITNDILILEEAEEFILQLRYAWRDVVEGKRE